MDNLEVILKDLKRLASEKDGDLLNIKPQKLKFDEKPAYQVPDIPEWAVEIEKDLENAKLNSQK